MRDFVVFGLYLFVVVGALFLSLLMLVNPAAHFKVLDWMTGVPEGSRPNPAWRPGIQWRLAGLAVTIVALIMLSPVVVLLFRREHGRDVGQAPVPQESTAPDWYALAFGLGLAVAGFLALRWPDSVLRWVAKARPDRIIEDANLRGGRVWVRVLAAVIMVQGIHLLWRWMGSLD